MICYHWNIHRLVTYFGRFVLSISLLRTFIAISERGSFSAAADHVCLTHAAVGQQMKRLEENFQIALFDRSQKSPQLNQTGKALVPKAREVVYAYEALYNDITGDAQLAGELTLGAVPSTIRGLIPLSIKKLINSYPDLHIRVVPGLSGSLLEQVERGGVDAAVLGTPIKIAANLNWQPFVKEKFVLLASPEVADKEPRRLLQSMPYIRQTRNAAAGLLAEEWLMKNKIAVSASMEMESLESVSSMVAHNLGVSIVPDLCVADPIFTKLKKIPLGSNTIFRELGILTRSDCAKIHIVDRFLAEIEKTIMENKVK